MEEKTHAFESLGGESRCDDVKMESNALGRTLLISHQPITTASKDKLCLPRVKK